MFNKILVPLDGSELSERAIPFARQLAGTNGRLILARATVSHRHLGATEMQAQDEAIGEAERYLAHVTDQLAQDGTDVEWRVYYGPAGEGIREEARLHRASSIVMSTHGRSGVPRLVFGSVAEQVLRETIVPLLMVPARSRTSWTAGLPKQVVVPLDGSQGSEAALEPAVALAGRLGASLFLLGVVQPLDIGSLGYATYLADVIQATEQGQQLYLESVARRLRARGLRVATELDLGFPAATIADVARAEQTAAVVMASHGRAGLAGLVLGSVAANLVRHSMAPLLVVRPLAWQHAKKPVAAEARSFATA